MASVRVVLESFEELRDILLEVHSVDIVQELVEFHDVRLAFSPFCSKFLECIPIENVHKRWHIIESCWYWVFRIENKPININSINLVFRVIKWVQQFLSDIDTCYGKEEPLIFNLTCFVHFKSFWGIFLICDEVVELLKAKQARTSEICSRIISLETNVNPFLGYSLTKFFIWFECAPKFH